MKICAAKTLTQYQMEINIDTLPVLHKVPFAQVYLQKDFQNLLSSDWIAQKTSAKFACLEAQMFSHEQFRTS